MWARIFLIKHVFLLYFLKNKLILHQHEIILPFKTPTFSNAISNGILIFLYDAFCHF